MKKTGKQMRSAVAFIILIVLSVFTMKAQSFDIIVADSATHAPLPGASLFDRNGKALGISNNSGIFKGIQQSSYPIYIRYLGFNDMIVEEWSRDTVFLSEFVSELPEMIVETRDRRLLHVLAYVREYSTLSTYTDTVFLFREKMVDYMVPNDLKSKVKGWTMPRTLSSKSYFRFTDANGLDSVSDVSSYHFSWCDWMGLPPDAPLPERLRKNGVAADTLRGQYSSAEIWGRADDGIRVSIDVLADKTCRKWVPSLSGFFRGNLDFERFKVSYSYENIDDRISVLNLARYSFDIESRGRGREMFLFNRTDQPFFVTTHADIYILDKEYITVKEGRKWEKREFDTDVIGIYLPQEAPELSPSIVALINRVDHLDKDKVRLDFIPDERLVSHHNSYRNFSFGNRALFMLKQLTGISRIKFDKNQKKNWNTFKKETLSKKKK